MTNKFNHKLNKMINGQNRGIYTKNKIYIHIFKSIQIEPLNTTIKINYHIVKVKMKSINYTLKNNKFISNPSTISRIKNNLI